MNASDVVWGVDPNKLILNQLEDGQTIYLPKSRCSEPCSQGAVKKMTEVCICMLDELVFNVDCSGRNLLLGV